MRTRTGIGLFAGGALALYLFSASDRPEVTHGFQPPPKPLDSEPAIKGPIDHYKPSFYIVDGSRNLRKIASRDAASIATVKSGSCVQEFDYGSMRGEFTRVTLYADKIHSGWMLNEFMVPAPSYMTENTCRATVGPPQP